MVDAVSGLEKPFRTGSLCQIRSHAIASPSSSLTTSISPCRYLGFKFRRVGNTNCRNAACIAPPATIIAAYLIDPRSDLVLWDNVLRRILGKNFRLATVHAAKRQNVSLGLSGVHGKIPSREPRSSSLPRGAFRMPKHEYCVCSVNSLIRLRLM